MTELINTRQAKASGNPSKAGVLAISAHRSRVPNSRLASSTYVQKADRRHGQTPSIDSILPAWAGAVCTAGIMRCMNFDQVRAAVLAATQVTPQTVMVAKVHIVANFEPDPSSLI